MCVKVAYLSPSAQCYVCRPAPGPLHRAWLTPSPCQSAESNEKRYTYQ